MAALLLALFVPSQAYAEGPASASEEATTVVKVGYYPSRNFQEGAEEGQIKSGYGYEYLQRVASYAGWQCEYEYGTWREMYQKLRTGEIDVMVGVSRTGQRATEVLFPSSGILNETFYIYKATDNSEIQSGNASSLSGKAVGVVSDSTSEVHFDQWLAENQCGAVKRTFPNIQECRAAYQQGTLDAFVSADNLVHDMADIQPIEIVGKEPYYLAVSKNRPDLLSQVNAVLPVMNSLDRSFLAELQSRYAADTTVNAYVTSEERDWVESHDTLTIGYLDNYLPFSDTDSSGNPTGLLIDVVPEILDMLPCDWDPEITTQAFADQQSMVEALESGQIDVAFPVGGGTWFAEQAGYVRSSPVMSPSADLVAKEPYDAETVATRVAVNRSNQMQKDYVRATYPDAQLIEYDSIEECLNAVKRGDATCTVLDGLRATPLLNNEPSLFSVQLPDNDDRCFAVAEGNGALLELLNRGISLMGTDYGTDASYKYTTGLFKYTWQDFVGDNWVTLLICLITLAAAAALLALHRYRKLEAIAARDAQMNKQLEEALDKARHASHAKDMLLRNLSHDIRTPLNGILGAMDLNANAQNAQDAKASLSKAKDASQHLVSLVDDLLEISTLRSGKSEASSETFNISELVREVVSEKGAFAEAAQVSIAIETLPASSEAEVRSDRGYLKKILGNVIDNAIRYNKPGGTVSIAASLESGQGNAGSVFICHVSDTGIGMSEQNTERMFEPFFQADEGARSEYPGSGLGMSIVRELLKALGGEVKVHSELGIGTEVALSIPLERVTLPAHSQKEVASPDGVQGMRVLLVEDNPLNLEVAQCILEQAGAQVETAENGKEALDAFTASEQGHFDAVLMDVMMPVMDGIQAARAIRALPREDANTPILATTAKVTEEDRREVLAAGMNEHIAKPLDQRRLIAILSSYRSR